MKRKRELGYCCLTTSTNGSWHLERGEFKQVRDAWLKGAHFVDTVSFYGNKTTIKLRDVDSVEDVTPECLQACIEEKRADESDDSLAGGAV